ELGLAAYLTKPITQKLLHQAITRALAPADAAASAPAETTSGERSLVTRHSLQEETRKLRILLAEDNPVNQQVAITLLERRGHRVTLAADGREAVDAIERESFDVVLMDAHMPNLSGFEATAIIRQRER